jgi:septal ring factor EnvC (AmiA/AmiB activator)
MTSEQDISVIAKQVSDVTAEVDALTIQIQPVLDRIKELKRTKKELTERLAPMMQSENVDHVKTPSVQISMKQNATRMPSFNRASVEEALREYFRVNEIKADAEHVLQFIDEYRKNHKTDIGTTILYRKSADYIPPNVQTVQPAQINNNNKNTPRTKNVVELYNI